MCPGRPWAGIRLGGGGRGRSFRGTLVLVVMPFVTRMTVIMATACPPSSETGADACFAATGVVE